ncbi:ankyrin repeat domain-containing protein 26-like [Ictidomys tridecemlineatus]|nr:ankyrin repeat domain-containing protein 26-like [Ictidomys tridecemlineatus]
MSDELCQMLRKISLRKEASKPLRRRRHPLQTDICAEKKGRASVSRPRAATTTAGRGSPTCLDALARRLQRPPGRVLRGSLAHALRRPNRQNRGCPDARAPASRKAKDLVLEERNDIQRQLSQKENVRILQDGILCKQKEIETTQEKMSSETQAESQHLQQIRENNSASIKGQMELRIKHLESELFKMRTQEDSNRKQLGIYQEICLEGFQITKSLSDELDKTNEKLKEVNTKLLIEKHYNRSLQHSTLSTRPVSECHCTVNHDCFVFDRSFTPRRNLVAPTSNPWPSNESMQNPRVWQELQENITREVTEAAAELESRSFRVSPLGCTNK